MWKTVSQSGDGDFRTVSEAAAACEGDRVALRIRNGLYREKLTLGAREIILVGEDPERTVLSFGDGAFHPDGAGGTLGTFRSYTLFLGAERALIRNLTVENTAGEGEKAGQAVALYADAALARFERVRLSGRQDTLFLAPLPERPRIPCSFAGPREHAPRRPCTDYLCECRIEGDVDFIFGGAQAAFENCEIVSAGSGWIAAPCTPRGQKYGFLFHRCRLVSAGGPGPVFLARPWRPHAKAAFLDCKLGAQIDAAGWDDWNGRECDRRTAEFAEYRSAGAGAAAQGRAPWARRLTDVEARGYLARIREIGRATAWL